MTTAAQTHIVFIKIFCFRPVLLSLVAPLNDIVDPLFLLSSLSIFFGLDAQHDIFL